jgi:hypothetical protein
MPAVKLRGAFWFTASAGAFGSLLSIHVPFFASVLLAHMLGLR